MQHPMRNDQSAGAAGGCLRAHPAQSCSPQTVSQDVLVKPSLLHRTACTSPGSSDKLTDFPPSVHGFIVIF